MSKHFFFISLITTTLLFSSCEPDNISEEPEIVSPLVALNYDDRNQDSPSLPAGNYEAAIRIPATDLSDLQGGELIEIYYYIREKPSSATVKVYKKSDSNSPVEQVYSAATTSEVKANSWNKHILSTPVEITGDDLWLSVKLGHTENTRSIGCDPGPAVENGDWLFDDADSEWLPLSDRSAISINWNIRGVVKP